MRRLFATVSVFAIALGGVACSEDPPPLQRSEQRLEAQPALVSIQFFDPSGRPTSTCAGTLVGPQAVLTAGHCASNRTSALVTAPNAGGKKATSHRAWWFDWTDGASPKSSPQLHDVAILALDSPIEIASYPKIAESSVAGGRKTTHVRRVRLKSGAIRFEAVSGIAQEGRDKGKGSGHHHRINTKKDSLDSGGAVFDPETGKIIGVVSAKAGSGVLHVVKTKALTKWLKQQLLALLKNPPKKDNPDAKPDAGATEKPGGEKKPQSEKPPTSGSAPKSGGGGGMGKQSGGGTKSQGKSGGAKSGGAKEKDPAEKKDGDEENPRDPENAECEGGDLDCQDVCEEGGGEDCETPCDGDDDSCETPTCEEGDECECDGVECEDDIEDPDDTDIDPADEETEADDYGDDYQSEDYESDDGDYGDE